MTAGRGLFEDWFQEARQLEGLAFSDHSVAVEYQCHDQGSVVVHHQVFDEGRLLAWRPGSLAGADLVVRQPLWAHVAMLTRRELGGAVLAATEVVDPESGQPAAPPPLDEVGEPWGRHLPVVPTAGELVVVQVVTRSPFGTVKVFARFDRGRVVAAGLGVPARVDVVIERAYGAALAEREGAVDLLESVEGGYVEGDHRKLTVLLGILESDECVAARRGLTRRHRPLAALGEVLSSAAWEHVGGRLATGTVAMRSVP